MNLELLGREGRVTESGMDMCTLLFLKWITNKDLLYSTWNSAQCYVAAGMGAECGGAPYIYMDPYICMAASLHCLPEMITTLLIGYTPIQNKKLKRGKKS